MASSSDVDVRGDAQAEPEANSVSFSLQEQPEVGATSSLATIIACSDRPLLPDGKHVSQLLFKCFLFFESVLLLSRKSHIPDRSIPA